MSIPSEVGTAVQSGAKVVASVSGGKDSTAMALHLMEIGVDFIPVFMDTGWEHDATYEYLNTLEGQLGIEIVRLQSEGMESLCIRKGVFPSKTRRFCTEALKVKPMKAFLSGFDDPVNAVGVRSGESLARSKLSATEEGRHVDALVWRPILDWTLEDVVEIHRRHGVAPNPLYEMGAERVGCWPCVFSRKSEIRLISEIDPPRIDRLRALEERLTSDLRSNPDRMARAERDAEERAKTSGYSVEQELSRTSDRTFFHGKGPSRFRGLQPPTDIDTIVEWSKTVRGGWQYPLFDDDGPSACVRWGLCEAPGNDDED